MASLSDISPFPLNNSVPVIMILRSPYLSLTPFHSPLKIDGIINLNVSGVSILSKELDGFPSHERQRKIRINLDLVFISSDYKTSSRLE